MPFTIAVATPTGNVGRRIAAELVRRAAEEDLRVVLLARDAARVAGHRGPAVRVEEGRLEEPGYLEAATRGADALYLATPHGFPEGLPVRAGYRRVAEEAARALRANGIRHAVHLSGFVAVDDGLGEGSMLGGLADTEAILDRAAAEARGEGKDAPLGVTHLRAGFFMENFLGQIDTVARLGRIFVPVRSSARVPMVASRDVAAEALRALRSPPPLGATARSVLGPRDLSFAEAAAEMSAGLERRVRITRLPRALIRRGMLRRERSPRMTEALLAVFRAAHRGRLCASPGRDEASTTPTTLEDFARDTMRPLLEEEAPAAPMCPARVQ